MRLFAGAAVLLQLSMMILADSNFTAISMQSPNINTFPFRGFDDRPADCPPWYFSLSFTLKLI